MKLMNIYNCGCYNGESCMVDPEVSNCIYYLKCSSGKVPPQLIEEPMDDGTKILYITDLI